jgi:hypothetical protein
MYRSLLRYGGDFQLWIICFDDLTYELLNKLNLEKVTLITLSQFEDEELLRIKPERSLKNTVGLARRPQLCMYSTLNLMLMPSPT